MNNDRRKCILFIVDSMNLGGTQEFIVNYARQFPEFDVHILSIFGDNDYRDLLEKLPNVRATHIVSDNHFGTVSKLLALPWAYVRFALFVRGMNERFDWINIRLPLSLLLSWLCRLHLRKQAHYTVDCDARQLMLHERAVFSLCLPSFQSVGINGHIRTGYQFLKLKDHVLRDDPYFVTVRKAKEPVLYDNRFNLLFIARLIPQKGLLEALMIMRTIHDSYDIDLHLHVLGDGPARAECESFCRDNALNSVTFYGYRRDVDGFFDNCNGIIKTAIGEPVNSVVRETVQAGKLVFSTVESELDAQYVENGFVVQIERTNVSYSSRVIVEALFQHDKSKAILATEPPFSNNSVKQHYLQYVQVAVPTVVGKSC